MKWWHYLGVPRVSKPAIFSMAGFTQIKRHLNLTDQIQRLLFHCECVGVNLQSINEFKNNIWGSVPIHRLLLSQIIHLRTPSIHQLPSHITPQRTALNSDTPLLAKRNISLMKSLQEKIWINMEAAKLCYSKKLTNSQPWHLNEK